ncbi:MAG: carbon monoxide dehydrogenase [Candidatus Omnitrophica bacterium]|nr:carbon monoxide dehydrogenase [Candidatus Omnitrophota bacterium]
MGCVIAMAGKGGTGKTTVAALIVRMLRDAGSGSILAVDADPNSNLGEALGLEAKETIGRLLDDVAARPQSVPPGMGKDAFLEYRVQTILQEGEGFDLLVMGKPEGPGCYCYVNNVLRNVMAKLIEGYDYIVIDNEAGLEHLSRRTTRAAEALVVVSDAGKVGLRSAKRINTLADELGLKIARRLLVLNRFEDSPDPEALKGLGLEYAGNIPTDDSITRISLNGASLMGLDKGAASVLALQKIGEKLWRCN